MECGDDTRKDDHYFSYSLVATFQVSGAGLSRAERMRRAKRPLRSLRNELHLGAEGIEVPTRVLFKEISGFGKNLAVVKLIKLACHF